MNEHSFLVEDQKFVAPICCSECDDKRVTRANVASNLRAWGYLTESFEDRLLFTGDRLLSDHGGEAKSVRRPHSGGHRIKA